MIQLILTLVFAVAAGLVSGTFVHLLPRANPQRVTSRDLATRPGKSSWAKTLLRGRLDPYAATGLPLTPVLVAALITATVLGIFAAMIHANTGVVTLDLVITHWAAANATGTSLDLLGYLTQAGGTIVITVITLAAIAYAMRRPDRWSAILFILAVVGGQLLFANVLKTAIGRTRPDLPPFSIFSGRAFPSGHATAAAAVWSTVALIVSRGRSRRARAMLVGGAVCLAVAVACSRVFIGAHWTSDVIGGLILGWTWFGLCAVVLGGHVLTSAKKTAS